MSTKKTYYGFGFNISSEIELPLPVLTGTDKIDVTIKTGKIPDDGKSERKITSYSLSQDSFIMNLRKNRIFTSNGKDIVIEVAEGEEPLLQDIVPFILSSCIGALLHQNLRLPLHASSVLTEKGAVLFLGNSSGGKSTISAILQSHGYKVLSDDISPISIIEGKAVVCPSAERLQLWKDILNAMKISSESLHKVRHSIEKYYYSADSDNILPPQNISAVYLLSSLNNEQYSINDKFSASQKINILKNHIFCSQFAKEMCIEHQYYKTLKYLAMNVPVKEFVKPGNEFDTTKLTEILEEDFKN